MGDSTSIVNLPHNKIALDVTDKPITVHASKTTTPTPNQPPNVSNNQSNLSNDTINKIISGIQNASAAGLTKLPSRDIPRNTDHITNDMQVKPNYIPQANNEDYITQHDSYATLLKTKKNNIKEQNRLDKIYDELQTPLMVTVLYFFLQMPSFTRLLARQLPMLFLKDGRPTFGGYVTKSLIFGGLYFGINKLTHYLSVS